MKRNFKKIYPAFSLSVLMCTGVAYADSQPSKSADAAQKPSGSMGMINTAARPYLNHSTDVCFSGDFLWWQATENGLSFAISNQSEYGFIDQFGHFILPNDLSDSKVVHVDTDWGPGFRVGFGLNTNNDGWDLNFTWLRYYTHNKKSVSGEDGTWLVPNLIAPAATTANNLVSKGFGWQQFAVGKARSRWDLKLNQLDLSLGREFFVGSKLTMRPNVGVRSAWINQKLDVDYAVSAAGFSTRFNVAGDTFRADIDFKNNFWGVGIAGGLDTQWILGCGWSIYGDLEAALLYGFFHVARSDELSVSLLNGAFPPSLLEPESEEFVDTKNSYRDLRAILDLQLGLKWSHNFNRDRGRISFHAGWESHVYFDQNQFMFFSNATNIGTYFSNQGNLNLQGWTAGAEIDF